ncbi:ASCH domain-containing protein [Nanobdella aerobiophila]|uniref:ASCH domain-containing protein n=1 Tax=Nanobdella aerobiophila TaxID=2586965 RepID=A0A915SA39_9ARCH|nr:ASCH domain-containing protein [Nanobdella aerobiophila]BBL45487.1 ASCH domain-containing protein [Nanobdella aerobiophila]
MKNIQFYGKYLEDILSGKKRITIRLSKGGFKIGDIFILHAGGKAIGKYRIKNIYTKKLYQITDEEAKLDGYNNKEELINEILRIYKNINIKKEVVIIEFEPLEIFKTDISSEEYAWGGQKVDIIKLANLILKYDDQLTSRHKELLNILIKEGSLRKAALSLGNIKKRNLFRKILKKGYERLKKKKII